MVDVWTTFFDAGESSLVTQGSGVTFHPLPIVGIGLNEGFESDLQEALRADLVVIILSGQNPIDIVRGLIEMVGESQWRSRRAKVVLRTQDSHHQLDSELAIVDDVDVLAIAHANYLSRFPPGKAIHIPCSLQLDRNTVAHWIEHTPVAHDVDVVFPFQLYRGEPRNALAFEIQRELSRRGLTSRFGFFRYYNTPESPPRLWEELGRARVILNLPLRDDLNIRNFEASLFPSWHVTIRLPDHDMISMDWSNTVFVPPDPLAIVSRIAELLGEGTPSVKPVPVPSLTPREVVLRSHVLNDRVYQIVDELFGTDLQHGPKLFEKPARFNQKPAIVDLYTPRRLLEKSPTILHPLPTNILYRPPLSLRIRSTLVNVALAPRKILQRLMNRF